MIEAKGLSKFYGNFAAVRDVTFSVPAGQVVALLGPNGAGKTTTMKLLTGFLSPSQGRATIAGHEVLSDRVEAMKNIGYLPENGPLYGEMTPREMLHFFGKARGMDSARIEERIRQLTAQCGLSEILDKPTQKLSKGNRQRVGMAQALLHEPKVLILDEPTSGLDPNQIIAMRSLIAEFGKSGTVILSTHILQEVEAMASRVIFINDGRVIFDGPVSELKAKGPDMTQTFAVMTGFAGAAPSHIS